MKSGRSPWAWVPTVNFAEGVPYILVNSASVIVYKKLGVPNDQIAYWTSLLAFPWVIKPLWGPLVDLYWTKRKWIILMQGFMTVMFGVLALTLQSPTLWWAGTLSVFLLIALLSATHDIAADGFYMIALDQHKQSVFVGIRSTFYRIAMITGSGLLPILAGSIEAKTGPPPMTVQAIAVPKGTSIANIRLAPSEGFLKFVPETVNVEAGTTAAVMVSFSKAPETTVVVSINRKVSSVFSALFPVGPEQQIKLTKGDRLEFAPDNWDKPQRIVLAADSKLKKEAHAEFEASAGNIAVTWGICFGGMCALFFILFVINAGTLPAESPGIDSRGARPPFLKAVAALVGTMLVPVGVFYGLMYGYGTFLSFVPLEGMDPSVLTFASVLLTVGTLWLLLKVQEIRDAALDGFKAAARMSGVGFDEIFISFFQKPGICMMITFLLLYRLGEAMLLKFSGPFLLDSRDKGGIGLTQGEYGLAYGTVGLLMLTAGGIIGGILAGSGGLRKWLFWMCLGLNFPHLLYVFLAWAKPDHFPTILACVAGEQFGYGFGFAAYMVYMLYIAGQGEHKTSHYALCTGFMALSMMLPGMVSGSVYKIIETMNKDQAYFHFFIVVVLCGLPGLLLLPFVPLDPNFGKKTPAARA